MAKNFNIIFINITFILFMQSIPFSVFAKNLEVYGETFPIIEQDLKEVIYKKLHTMEQNGELEKLKIKFIHTVKAHVLRPSPVEGITTTTNPQVFYYDPTYILKEDIVDAKDQVIVKAGTKVNPLDTVVFRSAMLFFDADDMRQVNWVENEAKKHELVKYILVQGDIKKIGELLKERVYFDQGGTISHKLGIKRVPCIVTQAGKKLKISEVNIDELFMKSSDIIPNEKQCKKR